MTTLAEKIQADEEALVTLKDDLVEATKKLEAAPDEEELLIEVEELTGRVEKAERTLAANRKAEAVLAARAKPVQQAPNVIPEMKKEPKQPGDIMLKHAVAKFVAFCERKPVEQVMDERYGDQNFVKASFDFIRKTHIDPAMTSVTGWAAELVREDVRGFIDTLKDVSVAAALAGRSTMLDFGGAHSIKVPRRNPLAATLTEPAWVAEGRPIPLTKFSFGSTTINRYKLAAITTWTRELAEQSTPAIEGLMRDALREAYAEVLDAALLSNAAAIAGVRPSGLLYDDFNGAAIASLTPTAGGGEDAVRGDVMNLMAALTGVKLGARPVLLVNNLDRLGVSMMTSALSEYTFRDELASGNLLGIPVVASANVPQHHVVVVDSAYLASAFDAPVFDVSDVATVVENSADTTAPTMVAVTASGAAGANAGQVAPTEGVMVNTPTAGAAAAGSIARSLWQTYSVGVRMVAPTSWAVMQPGAVAHVTPTTWTA